MRFFVALLWLNMMAADPAAAEENGERLFTPCRACHSLIRSIKDCPVLISQA